MCSTHCPDERPKFDLPVDPNETEQERHERIARDRERYKGAADLRAVANGYRIGRGLPEPDLTREQCSLERAYKIAEWHAQQPELPWHPSDLRRTLAAYTSLVSQVDDQLLMAAALGITIEYVEAKEPYFSAVEQAEDVIQNRHLAIATIEVWPANHHPLLGNEAGGAYDRFRAVHDLFGHVAIGTGFDRHGEWLAFITHSSMFYGGARQAAATELHGENSVLTVTGTPAKHKAALMPEGWCVL